MRVFMQTGAALLPLIATLAACSGSPGPVPPAAHRQQPAHFTYIDDVSLSPATINDPSVTAAVERRIGEDMAKSVRLGDTLTLYEAGARSADRMVAHPSITTDYNLRIPAAYARLIQQMRAVAVRYHTQGGDNATNLLLTLESIRPDCTPRSTVTIVTDGVEESDAYSAAKALAADRPVNLPPPSGAYLRGCRVQLLGFGLTIAPSAEAEQLLPARQLAALRRGWENYLKAAGVKPEDMEFISVL